MNIQILNFSFQEMSFYQSERILNKNMQMCGASQVALVVKNPPANAGRCQRQKFNPWVGQIPSMRAWQPISVFLPGESRGQRSLESYSPQGHTEQTRLKRPHTLACTQMCAQPKDTTVHVTASQAPKEKIMLKFLRQQIWGCLLVFRSFNSFFIADLMRIKLKYISARDILIIFCIQFFKRSKCKMYLGMDYTVMLFNNLLFKVTQEENRRHSFFFLISLMISEEHLFFLFF